MARIRSIHPGLFTDEVFMSLSMPARVLLLGLWTEADDHGVFEWKPVTLKARLLPADNVVVADLLTELSGFDVIDRREEGGSVYGLIRNFCRWQRPKNPAYKHTFPQEWGSYVAWKAAPTPADGEDTPPPPPNPPQRKEEGGKRESPPNPRTRGALSAEQSSEFESWYALYPHKVGRGAAERAWASARALASIEDLKAGVERYVGTKRPDVPWCNPATWLNAKRWMDAPADPKPAEPTVSPLEEALKLSRLAKWSGRLGEFKQTGKWQSTWGSEPWTTNSGCFVPVEMRPDFVAAYRSMTAPPIDPPEQRSIQ